MNNEFLTRKNTAAVYNCEQAGEKLRNVAAANDLFSATHAIGIETLYILATSSDVYKKQVGKELEGMLRSTFEEEWSSIPDVCDLPAPAAKVDEDACAVLEAESADLVASYDKSEESVDAESVSACDATDGGKLQRSTDALFDYERMKVAISDVLDEFADKIFLRIKQKLQ